MSGKDSTFEHGYKYDAKTGVSSCKCGYEAGLRITLGEHIKLEEYKATLKKRIEERNPTPNGFKDKDVLISKDVVLAEIEKD